MNRLLRDSSFDAGNVAAGCGQTQFANHAGAKPRLLSQKYSPGDKPTRHETILNHLVSRSTLPNGEGAMQAWSFFKRAVMGFWYVYVKALTRLWPSITLDGKRLAIFPGVYKPLENEPVCAEYCHEGDRVLDLGSGSGVCSVFCAPKAREVVAVDISAVAVKNTKENCQRLGLRNVVAMQSDMFSRVQGKFDLILANPPYVAADFENEEEQFATSVRYLPALFAGVGERLTDEGRLLVQFPIWFRGRIEGLAARHGLQVVSVKRLPAKSLGLSLLSLVYMQVGFRSAHFLIQPMPADRIALAA
jgi:SAM-dependent methyltransferase